MRAAHRILSDCRASLSSENSSTFIKFIKIAYGVANVTVSEDEAVKLYVLVQSFIRTQIGNY
jgi:hypothetical protein